MKPSQLIVLFGLVCFLTLTLSCGGDGSVSTVQAQTPTYSDSNVSGTYNMNFAGVTAGGAPLTGTGSFTADGNGNITAGTYTTKVIPINPYPGPGQFEICTGSLTGTYGISSEAIPFGTGTGTATLAVTPNSNSTATCPTASLTLSLSASTSGNTIGFSEADSTQSVAGVAVK